MKKKASKKKAPVVVNRKFLLDLANDIYDPKTRRFLRLCCGTLQNGPDPTDEERPMHCGLGELYYAMTGMQPHGDYKTGVPSVNEADVIDMACKLSTLNKHRTKTISAIKGA